ncbi:hypothetical protein EXIGLDRAFT_730443 [Exidia glandulosa HHB12029]|uniref:Uncharacterized protein n=1 Tax=Exidia glandulosa HHB12029 TaxID=1314781 RepID=A0A165L8K0_EXIGL|nr:hypothetical protein EXIGLDRAFT_730443 [Exidia glandulosa HHB12029]
MNFISDAEAADAEWLEYALQNQSVGPDPEDDYNPWNHIPSSPPPSKEDLRVTPRLAYMDPSWGDSFSYFRSERFRCPGNEDGKLVDIGLRFHELLATLQEARSLTDDEHQEFHSLLTELHDRASRLPTHEGRGCDNYRRAYTIAGRHKWTSGLVLEYRVYDRGVGIQIWFSICSNNFFYHNPEGDYYGHYEVLTEGGARATRGIKIAPHIIRRYEYPPDAFTCETGGQAARF